MSRSVVLLQLGVPVCAVARNCVVATDACPCTSVTASMTADAGLSGRDVDASATTLIPTPPKSNRLYRKPLRGAPKKCAGDAENRLPTLMASVWGGVWEGTDAVLF